MARFGNVKAAALVALAFAAACTPGGIPAATGGGGGGGGRNAVTTIDVNLTQHAPVQTPAGTSGGYAPPIAMVAVGSTIRFHNSDGFAHTATLIPGATTFPPGSPFSVTAQTQSGTNLSNSWSSGTLQPGSTSQTLLVDKAGTYLFGCFFHYGSPMRATIVAQ